MSARGRAEQVIGYDVVRDLEKCGLKVVDADQFSQAFAIVGATVPQLIDTDDALICENIRAAFAALKGAL